MHGGPMPRSGADNPLCVAHLQDILVSSKVGHLRVRHITVAPAGPEDALFSTFVPRTPPGPAPAGAAGAPPPGPPLQYEPDGRRFRLLPSGLGVEQWMGWPWATAAPQQPHCRAVLLGCALPGRAHPVGAQPAGGAKGGGRAQGGKGPGCGHWRRVGRACLHSLYTVGCVRSHV
jgi:hypothetical protein